MDPYPPLHGKVGVGDEVLFHIGGEENLFVEHIFSALSVYGLPPITSSQYGQN
jgi:hypothetical protein